MAFAKKEGRAPDLVVKAQLEKGNEKSTRRIGSGWTIQLEKGGFGCVIKLEMLPMSGGWDGSIMIAPPKEEDQQS
jgi:hypothetical protein